MCYVNKSKTVHYLMLIRYKIFLKFIQQEIKRCIGFFRDKFQNLKKSYEGYLMH